MLYFIGQSINYNPNKKSLTLYRHVFPNIRQLGKFGDYRAKYGLEAAMPLFRQITFSWEQNKGSPIGDIMSGSIFSVRAADVIRKLRGEYDIFEPINIEGYQAFYITPKRVDGICADLDIFNSKQYRRATVVSEHFKAAWEAVGLLGAEFDPINKMLTYSFR